MSEVAGPSDLLLTPHEILNIAYQVIKPMPCEWEGCTVILNSWYNLTKHTLRHCDRISNIEGQYQCRYLRCAGRLHTSKDELKAHVDLSHLSRLTISCPVRDYLVNMRVTWAFDRLVATAPPLRRITIHPPPLPSQHDLHNWQFTIPLVSLPPHKPFGSLAPVEPISRKWRRLDAPDKDDSDSNHIIPLDDLVRPVTPSKECVLDVRKKLLSLNENQRLSYPQSMPCPLPRDDFVPTTIGFSIFERKFEELAKDGVVNREA
ncbi:hypothetical protein BDR07DRAFT_404469 [Suillus spraguei]|nr:hypothetical protein BDR07DRAFT_404469 [Suillus spraguei]